MSWLIGIIASTLISVAAYWKRSLSLSGVLGAIIVGTVLYGAGNIGWYGVLIAFFLSSTLLTKWKHATKAKWEEGYDKTGRRDFGQVMANGGLATILCLVDLFWHNSMWYAAFLGIMATVTADTWATEIGSLSKQAPRSILTGKVMRTGTSGAISFLGIAASAAGGCFIGIIAVFCSPSELEQLHPLVVIGITTISGLVGSLLDSLLGATYQASYQCMHCNRLMEKRYHCNDLTLLHSGYPFVTNDVVNVASSIGGAILSLLLFHS